MAAAKPLKNNNLKIKTVLYYAGHIFTVYESSASVDIFQVNGPLVEKLNLDKYFTPSNLQVKQINFINMPRLDWQDREFDTI